MHYHDRLFDPSEFRLCSTSFRDTVSTSPTSIRHLRSFGLYSDHSTLVINCSGIARSADIATTLEASFGVFFGPGNALNLSGCLPTHFPQTTQTAELYAAHKALEQVYASFHGMRNLDVVLAMDSWFVVNGLAGFSGEGRGGRMMIAGRFRATDALVTALERGGKRVLLWRVEKHENAEAVQLALQAFGGKK